MPTVTRSRTVPMSVERVWSVISDPEQLTDWWPGVQRVEEASRSAWTIVLTPPKGGRNVRLDFTLVSSDYPRRLSWRQEIEESPFERILSSAVTSLELEQAPDGHTEVQLSEQIGLRGYSHFGVPQLRRATKRKLDGALDGLERLSAARSAS